MFEQRLADSAKLLLCIMPGYKIKVTTDSLHNTEHRKYPITL